MTKQLGPQYWDTNCLVCGKVQFAAMENTICDECMEGDTVPEYIAKMQRELIELQKQNTRLIECMPLHTIGA